ncbi:MAG: hypothetical protein LBF80_06090, partial [Spirochaetaceae bacterium]|nr:hypothetical protein [Spirochaetaceae bacterium]
MFDYKKCRPIELDDLTRIGHESDGGYVLPKRCIEKTDTILSFGVSNDWSFEDYFTRKRVARVFSYDYSIKDSPWVEGRFYLSPLLAFIFDALTLNRLGVKRQLWRINASFKKFFNEKLGRYYIPKFIGPRDDEQNVSFDTVFNEVTAGGGRG